VGTRDEHDFAEPVRYDEFVSAFAQEHDTGEVVVKA
jgi:hypothetical protein